MAKKLTRRRGKANTEQESAPQSPPNGFLARMRERIEAEQARRNRSSGSGTLPYLKLNPDETRIRLLPVPFTPVKVHQHFPKKFQAVDFDWLFKASEDLARYAMQSGRLSEADREAWETLGDPWQLLSRALETAGEEDGARNLWSRIKYLFLVMNREDDELYVWDASKTAFDTVTALLDVHPELFDLEQGRDLLIKGNGEAGRKRRYKAPIALDPSPATEDEQIQERIEAIVEYNEDMPEDDHEYNSYHLLYHAATKIRKFAVKVNALFEIFPQQASIVGMDEMRWRSVAGERLESENESD